MKNKGRRHKSGHGPHANGNCKGVLCGITRSITSMSDSSRDSLKNIKNKLRGNHTEIVLHSKSDGQWMKKKWSKRVRGYFKSKTNQYSIMTNQEDIDEFNYMMLSRLQGDCKYFLGNGCGSVNNLWADSVSEHIAEMKRLYDILPIKPEWLSMEEILEYEAKMLPDVNNGGD